KPYIRWIEYCRVGFNPPIKSICYGYMVGQDSPYKLFFLIKHRKPLFTFSGCTNAPIVQTKGEISKISFPHFIVKKKKKQCVAQN
ncbi:hypothetical protein Q7440_11235, partial [Glaesserella parasuis]|nr:hypothetical protein [Glaesserella parasuis]